jgi:hypothetical protein
MKLHTLKKNLQKLEIPFQIKKSNWLNHSLQFTINEKIIDADFYSNDLNKIIVSFSTITGYDSASQENQRHFFNNFKSIKNYFNL